MEKYVLNLYTQYLYYVSYVTAAATTAAQGYKYQICIPIAELFH